MLNPLNDFNNDFIETDESSKNLNDKYKPELLSEYEYDYDEIPICLNKGKSFIINGSKNSGKSKLIKH